MSNFFLRVWCEFVQRHSPKNKQMKRHYKAFVSGLWERTRSVEKGCWMVLREFFEQKPLQNG